VHARRRHQHGPAQVHADVRAVTVCGSKLGRVCGRASNQRRRRMLAQVNEVRLPSGSAREPAPTRGMWLRWARHKPARLLALRHQSRCPHVGLTHAGLVVEATATPLSVSADAGVRAAMSTQRTRLRQRTLLALTRAGCAGLARQVALIPTGQAMWPGDRGVSVRCANFTSAAPRRSSAPSGGMNTNDDYSPPVHAACDNAGVAGFHVTTSHGCCVAAPRTPQSHRPHAMHNNRVHGATVAASRVLTATTTRRSPCKRVQLRARG